MAIFNYLEEYPIVPLNSSNLSLVISIFVLVIYWILLKKANEKGWKVLIPFYGEYTICKIAKKEKLFWWQLGISILTIIGAYAMIAIIVAIFGNDDGALILGAIIAALMFLVAGIASFIIKIKRGIALAKAFGQTTAFGVGIALLEPIFVAILALNKNIHYDNSYC